VLVVNMLTAADVTPGTRTILPTAKDVDSLLAALPRLQALTINNFIYKDYGLYKDPEPKALIVGREDFAPAFLKGLARKGCPVSQLITLNLDGALLSKMLLAHGHSLKQVNLTRCDLRGGNKALKWLEIFRVLSQLHLEELVLSQLLNPGVNVRVVLCTKSTEYTIHWFSHSNNANVQLHANGGVGLTGSAKFARHYARFTESYVELGLKKLLKSQDLELYSYIE
jgi:hypothetical protein